MREIILEQKSLQFELKFDLATARQLSPNTPNNERKNQPIFEPLPTF